MSKSRDVRRGNTRAAFTMARNTAFACRNCGGQGKHYLPPSMGEPGRFVCSVGSFVCSERPA